MQSNCMDWILTTVLISGGDNVATPQIQCSLVDERSDHHTPRQLEIIILLLRFTMKKRERERERELSVKALKVIHGVVLLDQTGYSVNLTLKDGVDELG